METHTKEVYYDQYCKSCEYKDRDEEDDICHRCLEQPYNYDSHKPIEYKSSTTKKG